MLASIHNQVIRGYMLFKIDVTWTMLMQLDKEFRFIYVNRWNIPQNTISTKKASRVRCLTFAPYAWRRFTPWGVMRCWRGLRTTHYIVRPRLTTLGLEIAWAIRVVIPSTNSPMTLQRYAVFLYLTNLYLSTSKSCIKMGIPSFKVCHFL